MINVIKTAEAKRVWHVPTNTLNKVICLDTINALMILAPKHKVGRFHTKTVPIEQCILEAPSGRPDKNGTMIFQNDMVKCKNENDRFRVIFSKKKTFQLKNASMALDLNSLNPKDLEVISHLKEVLGARFEKIDKLQKY